MKMTVILYGGLEYCPGARACFFLTKKLNIEIKNIVIDLLKREQLAEEFGKINPLHTIPTLDDDGVVICDSHAIMIYLADKYGNDNPVYPKDLAKRAAINRVLFFECGDVFSFHKMICCSILFEGYTEPPKEPLALLHKGLANLEILLNNSKYAAGDELTIADFSLWTTISNVLGYVTLDSKIYPNIEAWLKRMDKLPYADINAAGAKEFKEKICAKLEK